LKDNQTLKSQLEDHTQHHELTRGQLQRMILDKESEIDRLLNEVTQREAETQRLQSRCRESDTMRSQLLQAKEANERLEYERADWREKMSGLERRVQELSELLNLNL